MPHPPFPQSNTTTLDAPSDGVPALYQPRDGYRINTDPLLLAAFAAERTRGGMVVDLGAGVGTIGLTLAAWGKADELLLVESQPELAALARLNLQALGYRGSVLNLTLKEDNFPDELAGSAQLVVANPPYFQQGSGRKSDNPSDTLARFGALEPFVAASACALARKNSRACFAYPAHSLQSLLSTADRFGLFAKRLRLVHAKPESEARLALLELRRSRPGGLKVEPPLVEWSGNGQRSPAFCAFIQRPASDRG
ncbi:MAG: methyltransferase [Polyangiaceae bacterium]|nr:methyltransferase [Polyangiaceae bacterium]